MEGGSFDEAMGGKSSIALYLENGNFTAICILYSLLFLRTIINSINMPPRKTIATNKVIVSYDTIEVDTQPLGTPSRVVS